MALTRFSHHLTAEARNRPAITSLCLLAVLNVLFKYARIIQEMRRRAARAAGPSPSADARLYAPRRWPAPGRVRLCPLLGAVAEIMRFPPNRHECDRLRYLRLRITNELGAVATRTPVGPRLVRWKSG